MFASRNWTRFALAMNVAGALCLFLSFQATSSSFRLIKRAQGTVFTSGAEYEICVGDFILLSTDARGGVALGHRGCPIAEDDKPAAVVNTEYPALVTIGFLLTAIGFSIQFFAVPEPTSITELRREIKLLKKRQRQERQ